MMSKTMAAAFLGMGLDARSSHRARPWYGRRWSQHSTFRGPETMRLCNSLDASNSASVNSKVRGVYRLAEPRSPPTRARPCGSGLRHTHACTNLDHSLEAAQRDDLSCALVISMAIGATCKPKGASIDRPVVAPVAFSATGSANIPVILADLDTAIETGPAGPTHACEYAAPP